VHILAAELPTMVAKHEIDCPTFVSLHSELAALRALAETSPELRSICTRLAALVEALKPSDASATTARCVWTDRRCSWIRVEEEGAPTSLERRSALRRIVARLAETPRAPVSTAALLDAGWPGERVVHQAGSARVRTAIATLRRLGLRELLVTTGEGYMLDADVVQE
jgi:hypothetical protein